MQTGVDNGERRVLHDGSGKPAFVWTGAPVAGAAPYRLRHEYDVAERPTHVWLSNDGGAESLRSYVVYGEDASGDPEDLNLRTRVWRTFDTAGLVESTGFDFKGNALGSTRRLIVSNDTDPDWSAVAAAATLEDADDEADLLLESAAYTTTTTYDALNRPVTATTADTSVTSYTYDLGGSLLAQSVLHRGAGSPQPVVSDIQYNARGRRVSASLGNGTTQTYTYDPHTFRLARSRARRTSDGVDLQDLRYTYDPEGNPTEIRDKAQQRTFFNNDVVYPSRRYAYDALYRLTRAEGRETAFAPASPWSTGPTPEEPVRTGSDPASMRRYIENFSLDPNGNLLILEHVVPSNTSASWTRTMAYEAGSNRLATYQGTGGASAEEPAYDELGRTTEAPGIDELEWDADGRLGRTRVASGGAAETRYVYDGAGNRVRKARYSWVTDAWVKTGETVYVGGIDIEREFVAGNVEEEIETLHLSDAGRRIALVETRTVHEGDAVATPVGKWRFQHDDHLRSSCVETNVSGVVISYEEYHAFGTTAYSAHTAALEERAKRYRYSGKERDEESGLYYYGARYLAPWMGRWISPDPAGTVDGVNLFGFVRGRPSAGWDADGRQDQYDLHDYPNDVETSTTPEEAQELRLAEYEQSEYEQSDSVVLLRNEPSPHGEPQSLVIIFPGGVRLSEPAWDDSRTQERLADTIYAATLDHPPLIAVVPPGIETMVAVDEAVDLALREWSPEEGVVIYGFSHGGEAATRTATALEAYGVPVQLLVTVDAAFSVWSDDPEVVPRAVSGNVRENRNYFQTSDDWNLFANALKSRGFANTALDPESTVIHNVEILETSHQAIDEDVFQRSVHAMLDTLRPPTAWPRGGAAVHAP